MDQLKTYVELQAEKAENLTICNGIKLLHIRKCVQEMLSLIGRSGLFEEYTKHDISHIDEMLKITEWLIPESTKEHLSYAEWLMLTLAIYFHDMGMLVTKEEFENRDKTSFPRYKATILKDQENSEYGLYAVQYNSDEFLYQEFVRENHAIRVKEWIEGKENYDYGDAEQVRKEIDSILRNLDPVFRADLAMICESHHSDDINDFAKYNVKKRYGNSEDEVVNLNYIAIILRTSDLLHITRDRTPSISRRLINVRNPKSVIEWEKQNAVRAVNPQSRRNSNGDVDTTIPKDTIEVTAYFLSAEMAEAYFGLSSYLQYTKKELKKCADIVEKAQKQEGAIGYLFPWREIDESHISVKGFETRKLSFTISQENILQLLVGHTLYNDSSVVVRELVQNGIDAVRLQKRYDESNGHSVTDGKVQVDWNEEKRELSFWDNGTGMSIKDIENYLLKVGASKYRDDDIQKQFPDFSSISHFGIGILTCFMVADDIDIITNPEEPGEANSVSLRKVNGSYLLKKIDTKDLDGRIRRHGTVVRLHVRNDVDMESVESDLRKWIVLPEVPVYFTVNDNDSNSKRIGYDSLKEVLIRHLEERGFSVDHENYDVYEKSNGKVTMAYAVRHLKYMSDWCLMSADLKRMPKKMTLPIGTCVEGIRVEFNTPGYNNSSVLAVANIKNSKYQTNVARSAIELDANNEILSDIYDIYRQYIQDQMDKLVETKQYSKSWALNEGRFLMRPLLYDGANGRYDPMNEDVLRKCLAKLKCMTLENEGHREIVSAEKVSSLSEVNIFQCEMTRAAEVLLKEVKSDATLSSLIKTVCPTDYFLDGVSNVISSFDMNNPLHIYALKDKEVTKIDVAYKKRRIQLTYSEKRDRWYHYNLLSNISGFVYIPKDEFEITGLEDEVGVRSYGSIYLRSGTSFCDYLKKVISLLESEGFDENRSLLDVFLSYVFDSGILENVYKIDENAKIAMNQVPEARFVRVNGEMMEKMLNKIDRNEFADVVLARNYQLYSTDNWLRNER